MDLKNLKDFIDIRMSSRHRSDKKQRFKLVTTEHDQLMFYIKSKYRSNIFNKIFVEQNAYPVYDKDGRHVFTRDFTGDKVASLDELGPELDNLRIELMLSPPEVTCTKGDLLLTNSLYLAKIKVEPHLRGQGIATKLLSEYEKYAQVNGFNKLYGHGCAFGNTSPQSLSSEDELRIKELMEKYHLKRLSQDDKNLLLFYTKQGYRVDNSISKNMEGIEYAFAFSKKVTGDKIIKPNETLYFKDSKNKFDSDKILLS